YRPLEDAVDPSNMLCAGKDSSSVVEWAQCPGDRPQSQQLLEAQLSYETEWDMVNAVSFRKRRSSNMEGDSHERSRWAFAFSVSDLRSVTVREEGWTFIILQLKDSSTPLPHLHFHQGGSRAFLDSLRRFHIVRFIFITNYLFDEVADLLGEVIPGLEINQQEEPGFEVITRIDLGVRPEVSRKSPLTADDWARHQDADGRMKDVPDLKHAVFKGGLCHALRKEAWKFLLGYYPWESTHEERKTLQREKTDEYFRMKLQWKSVSEEQERRNSRLRDYRSLIEKDVNRTDRTNRFYEGIDNPGLVLLHDILMTYCMYDFDLGYVQGMSDLLSPILYVMENEVDAFWCFVAFMDQMHENFEEQMQGMKTQLIQLSSLLRLLDLAFWNYLESQDSGYLYFCFRWLLIRFKRELSFVDVLRLWEVMWTGLPCENFHLLVCCAILDSEKQKIMEENYGFNEILKHINELSMKLDIEEILQKAEGICLQIRSCKDLPRPVATILGFDVESRCADSTGCGSALASGAARREGGISNGHLRESSCKQSGRGAFVS
uniref:TBC1 domain family member 15 n=1 Tax=Oreochromis niloticus TaxID=8128 RepID=A0A669DVJ3_ORENI